MSDLRKAAEMALEALEMTRVVFKVDDRDYGLSRVSNAAEALRQALAQPKERGYCTCGDPEELGMVHFRTRSCIYYTAPPKQPGQEPVAWEQFHTPDSPFYTAPPKREWAGLTDEERADCWSSSAVQSAINIEAKLKEKNT